MDPLPVSQNEFFLFHKIDRDVYTILVMRLFRDPSESLQVLGMWLWLERAGFNKVVHKIHTLPHILINHLADDTVTCLHCISSLTPPPPSPAGVIGIRNGSEISLLQAVLEKEFSLPLLYQNRVNALLGVSTIVRDVCRRAVSDIMHKAMMRNAAEKMAAAAAMKKPEYNFWFGSFGPSTLRFGNNVGAGVAVGGGAETLAAVLKNQNHQSNGVVAVPADDRTLFVTFSKGYRVEEWEVREFFTMAYGDCVEALFMQEVQQNEQALFARIVFRKICTIDMILRGANKAKFTINGKHVWARKFVPKRTKSFLSGESSSGSGSGSGSGFGM